MCVCERDKESGIIGTLSVKNGTMQVAQNSVSGTRSLEGCSCKEKTIGIKE